MKRYSKVIDGKTIIKRAEEIVIKGNGSQTQSSQMDGWSMSHL